MRSTQSSRFSTVPQAQIPRSQFTRNNGYKTTFNASDLVPIYVDEVLPGDTARVKLTAFARMATPIHPIMDNLHMETFFFFVPNRLVWDNWQKFMGEQENPGDSIDYTVPQITTLGGYAENSLSDYMGLPTGVDIQHNVLHHRAYQLIFREFFRDQNLQDSPPISTGDAGDDPAELLQLRKRNKRHDYFTSCLPWPQKTENPVLLPLGTTAPISGIGTTGGSFTQNTTGGVYEAGGLAPDYTNAALLSTDPQVVMRGTGAGPAALPDVYADLSNATAATINELRQAFQVQRLLERDARGGTRYTEIIRSHFGVTSPDHRLQRPEYLGGGHSFVNITPVPQTSQSDATPQGQLAGYGTASVNNHGFTKSFTEHGVIIGLINVRADLTYQKGLDRMWSRQTRYDFYWPSLAQIGEQAVLNKEIFYSGLGTPDNTVFGFQERFGEYRFKQSKITGLFRSDAPGTLDPWHLAQDFNTLPTLSEQFIQENVPMDRVKAVLTEPDFILDTYYEETWARPMPLWGVPGMIDHF